MFLKDYINPDFVANTGMNVQLTSNNIRDIIRYSNLDNLLFALDKFKSKLGPNAINMMMKYGRYNTLSYFITGNGCPNQSSWNSKAIPSYAY